MSPLREPVRALVACVLLTGVPGAVRADSPAGLIFNLASNGGSPIIVLGALETREAFCEDQVCTDLATELNLVEDARGRVNGTAVLSFTVEDDGVPVLSASLIGPVQGRLRGAQSGTQLMLRYRLNGETQLGDTRFPTQANGVIRGGVSPSGILGGEERVAIRIQRLSTERQTFAITERVPGPFRWNLRLAVEDVGTERRERLVADARLELGDGDALRFSSPLRYNASRDLSSFNLRAADDRSRGGTVRIRNLEVTGDRITGGTLSYRVAGQSGDVELLSLQQQ